MCQAQKNIVFAPSHSFVSKGLIVKDMDIRLEAYPPIEVTMLSNKDKVGPEKRANSIKRPAKTKLVLVNLLIPLLIPLTADKRNKAVTMAIMESCNGMLLASGVR